MDGREAPAHAGSDGPKPVVIGMLMARWSPLETLWSPRWPPP